MASIEFDSYVRANKAIAFFRSEAHRAFKRYFLNLWDQKENWAIDLAQ
jgi:hypothetical protein